MVKNWKKRFFKLTPVSLQYYEKETLKGQISIVDARLQYEDDRLEFTVTSKDGHVLVMRADTVKTRDHWVNAVKEQLREQQDRLRATIGGAESPSAKKVEEVGSSTFPPRHGANGSVLSRSRRRWRPTGERRLQ